MLACSWKNDEAIALLKHLAERKVPPAFLELYSLYHFRFKDKKASEFYRNEGSKFYEWFENQAKKFPEDALFQYFLALCIEEGLGTTKDYILAREYYLKAHETIINAKFRLGVCYEFCDPQDLNRSKAAFWFEESAKAGHIIGCYNSAIFYEEGAVIPQNLTKSFEYSSIAAEAGHSYAQLHLGFCYQFGEGVNADIEKAKFWLESSAKQKVFPSMLQLSRIYEFHSKDMNKAEFWLSSAADISNEGIMKYSQFLVRKNQLWKGITLADKLYRDGQCLVEDDNKLWTLFMVQPKFGELVLKLLKEGYYQLV
jgi:TPR repeat protein